MIRSNLRNRAICILLVSVAIVTLGALVRAQTSPDEDSAHSYVRPNSVAPNAVGPESPGIFQDLGLQSVQFDFHTPPGKAAVFTTEARDADGRLIASLSRQAFMNPHEPDGTARGSFRLTRIDPASIIEDYRGKVRWVWTIGGSTFSVWETEHWSEPHGGWSFGKRFFNPEPGKEYLVWDIKAYGKHSKPRPDQAHEFHMQIKFKVEVPQGDPATLAGQAPYPSNE